MQAQVTLHQHCEPIAFLRISINGELVINLVSRLVGLYARSEVRWLEQSLYSLTSVQFEATWLSSVHSLLLSVESWRVTPALESSYLLTAIISTVKFWSRETVQIKTNQMKKCVGHSPGKVSNQVEDHPLPLESAQLPGMKIC